VLVRIPSVAKSYNLSAGLGVNCQPTFTFSKRVSNAAEIGASTLPEVLASFLAPTPTLHLPCINILDLITHLYQITVK